MGLTAQQEKFAQGVASGLSQSDAYRAAYKADKMKPETINKRSSELMQNGAIKGRVSEIQKPIVEKVGITLEWHLAELERMKNIALAKLVEAEKPGEIAALLNQAIKAQQSIGKDSGVAKDKKEVDVSDPLKELLAKVNGTGFKPKE